MIPNDLVSKEARFSIMNLKISTGSFSNVLKLDLQEASALWQCPWRHGADARRDVDGVVLHIGLRVVDLIPKW